ncbi:MAG: DUF488 domain-containing protein [Verrucomicrobia bacterium]|nr:DUF488 domain-containing protein [Verrucomicrobiota bacterium]
MHKMKLVTIGVYGFSETAFFDALRQAGVDTFCDIRWRRGVRGAEYAFANRARLEKRLAELGIRYLHLHELAATPALRQRQYEADKAEGTTKRKRSALGAAFIAGYREERLSAFDSRKFIEDLGAEARTVALFCVEREPVACHRSLVAERLQQDLGAEIEVVHLMPEPRTDDGAG